MMRRPAIDTTQTLFSTPKPLIGVLQLLPLPGSPSWEGRHDTVIARAEQEATAMATGGIDAILIENTFDAPHTLERVDHATAILMGLITRRVMHFTALPIGISVLKNDPETALAIAMNVGARFIRIPCMVGARWDEAGVIQGKLRQLTLYKNQLKSENIACFADVKLGQEQQQASPDFSKLRQTVLQTAEVGNPDAIILHSPQLNPEQLQQLTELAGVPVYVDYSGPMPDITPYLEFSNGVLVSQLIKKTFVVENSKPPAVDLAKVEELMTLTEALRHHHV